MKISHKANLSMGKSGAPDELPASDEMPSCYRHTCAVANGVISEHVLLNAHSMRQLTNAAR